MGSSGSLLASNDEDRTATNREVSHADSSPPAFAGAGRGRHHARQLDRPGREPRVRRALTSIWGGFTANIGGQSVGIPAGQLYHYISGSGYHISWEGANFGSVGNLCDTSVRFTYGNGSYRYDGNVHWGCSHVGQWKYAFNWNAPRGSACAQLWVANWRRMITKQCHYIYG